MHPLHFNPRAYVRHDPYRSSWIWAVFHFNPRAYVRHDRAYAVMVEEIIDFNPRAYVRHDLERGSGRTQRPISIHVPT